MTIFEERNLITLEQAAELLGIKLSTFRQHYSNRLNDVKQRSGARVYIPKDALNRFIQPTNISSN